MSSSTFPDSFDEISSPDPHPTHSTRPFDDEDLDDGAYAPPSYSNESSIFNNGSGNNNNTDDVVFGSNPDSEAPIYGGGFESNNGDPAASNGVFVESNGPILPPPDDMQEEGFALREWRRQNAIQLEQKEKREKEVLSQIIEEANEYKVAFHEKRKVTCESNKTNNREKEKVFLANHEKFHKEADQNYWKAIAELVPNEVPTIEKKRGKKDQEKKPSIVVIQGPKPGKPTDLARMRQILIKLKHTTPAHLKLTPPPPAATTKDAKSGGTGSNTPVVAASEAVVAA